MEGVESTIGGLSPTSFRAAACSCYTVKIAVSSFIQLLTQKHNSNNKQLSYNATAAVIIATFPGLHRRNKVEISVESEANKIDEMNSDSKIT